MWNIIHTLMFWVNSKWCITWTFVQSRQKTSRPCVKRSSRWRLKPANCCTSPTLMSRNWRWCVHNRCVTLEYDSCVTFMCCVFSGGYKSVDVSGGRHRSRSLAQGKVWHRWCRERRLWRAGEVNTVTSLILLLCNSSPAAHANSPFLFLFFVTNFEPPSKFIIYPKFSYPSLTVSESDLRQKNQIEIKTVAIRL